MTITWTSHSDSGDNYLDIALRQWWQLPGTCTLTEGSRRCPDWSPDSWRSSPKVGLRRSWGTGSLWRGSTSPPTWTSGAQTYCSADVSRHSKSSTSSTCNNLWTWPLTYVMCFWFTSHDLSHTLHRASYLCPLTNIIYGWLISYYPRLRHVNMTSDLQHVTVT